MADADLTPEQKRLLRKLAKLGEIYASPGFTPYKDPGRGARSDLVDELEEFGQLMYRGKNQEVMGVENYVPWFESPQGQRFLAGDGSIVASADFHELMTAWIVIQRNDYWSQPDRSLDLDFERGLITAVTDRAAALLS